MYVYLLPRNRIKGSSNLQKDSSTKNGNVNNSTNRNTFTKLRKTASSKGPYKKTGATLIPPIVHTPATSTKVRMVVPPAPVVSTKTCVSSVVRNHPNQNQYISQKAKKYLDTQQSLGEKV
ncbi:hypothetical protein AX774_g7210 [Zancudomyces culisetae]|uniref:Uncharacterized protein n=1 Tax=Zancudomyces culisetae TaxID=1213189 RepID=A0A1R1PEN5_ZANCU|nr:hypothetical protein AX774_g7210 [Zancudomyces culisetae]|eukprot:OMH79373.1 hypothetical protein AX774_g7210 [Zancudomyces culisetae]